MASSTFSCWPVEPLATALNKGLPCRADDVGHLQRWPVHAFCIWFSFSSDRECVQRTGGGAEMPPGKMQIDRCLLQVAMAQQYLDGAQVGAGFEQMCGKAVAQRVRMDVLVLKTGAFGGLLTGMPDDLGGDRMTRRVPSVAGKQPVGGLAPQSAPVDAQFLEQLRAEHDIAVLASLAAPDMDDHPLAVDIADLQVRHFRATAPVA